MVYHDGTSQLYHKKLEKTIETEEIFMNDSNIVEKMLEERELLHKELALLAEKSQRCEPELLADYALAMCGLYELLSTN